MQGTKEIDNDKLLAEVKKWDDTHRKGFPGKWKAIHGLVIGGEGHTQKEYANLKRYHRSIRLKAKSYVKNPPFTLTNPQINSICM